MTERTKYRIIGSIFLLSVCVVAIPMLLDGPRVDRGHIEPLPDDPVRVEVDDVPVPDTASLIEARDELHGYVDESGYRLDNGTFLGDPVLSPDSEDARHWAVQVGSFTDEVRAKTLRDKLVADGYPAWISRARVSTDIYYRVAVGPYTEKEEVSRLQAEIEQDFELSSIVLAFST